MIKIKIRTILLSIFSLFLFSSCASVVLVKDMSEEKGYETIKREYQKKRYEEVTKDVNEFRIRYPYSKYTAELELLQANSFYYALSFQSAAVTYEDFIKRNPDDPQVEFAQFRIAECYDMSSIKDDDRDQSDTYKAVEKYQVFLNKYPESKEYKVKAQKRLAILQRRLADHNLFIANFYWQKRLYAAALMRYLTILENYPQFEDAVKTASVNGSFCYKRLADILQKNPKSEEYIFFKNETPDSLRAKAKVLAE